MTEGVTLRDHYVYMILPKGGRLYTGYTTDPVRRYAEHLSGGRFAARFTRAFTPLSLAFCLKVSCSRSDILKVEAGIKKLSRRVKLRLISGEEDVDALVSGCCGRVLSMTRVNVQEIERKATSSKGK